MKQMYLPVKQLKMYVRVRTYRYSHLCNPVTNICENKVPNLYAALTSLNTNPLIKTYFVANTTPLRRQATLACVI